MRLFSKSPDVNKLQSQGDVESLMKIIEDHKNESQYHEAIRALGDIYHVSAIAALIELLGDNRREVVSAAEKSLVALGRSSMEPLINSLGNPNSKVRGGLARVMGQTGDLEAVGPLVDLLGNRDIVVHDEAVNSLRSMRNPAAVEPLVNALTDEDVLVRHAAATLLGEIGDSRAVEPLNIALNDQHVLVRKAAAMALESQNWRGGTKEGADYVMLCIAMCQWDKCVEAGAMAVEPLISALSDADWETRRAAAIALGQIGDSIAVSALIQSLKDNNKTVIKAAAEALGMIGNEQAVSPLLPFIRHKDWDMRQAAANALVGLFRRGQLSTLSKHKILTVKNIITQPHADCAEGADVTWGYHQDHGIGIRL